MSTRATTSPQAPTCSGINGHSTTTLTNSSSPSASGPTAFLRTTWTSHSRDISDLALVGCPFPSLLPQSTVPPLLGRWKMMLLTRRLGRRVCAGWFVASQNLFLSISRLAYCFDFLPVEGHPIPVGKPFSQSIKQAPFQVKIKVRSPAHEALIRRTCASAVFE